MGMGYTPTWLRRVSPPASQNHFDHWANGQLAPKMLRCLDPEISHKSDEKCKRDIYGS